MSIETEPAGRARGRSASFRRPGSGGAQRPGPQDPPRQRRPGLAALALLLIVGGALAAGLLAVRMDSREPVLAAARDIAPGTLITAADLREVQVASDGLALISTQFADQILDGGTYARVPIEANSLVDQNMLTKQSPIGDDQAVIAVNLNRSLTPSSQLRDGDLVMVARVTPEGSGPPEDLTEGLVLSVGRGSSDDLGGSQQGTVYLLVPERIATDVVDAAGADRAGVALLAHGVSIETELRVLK